MRRHHGHEGAERGAAELAAARREVRGLVLAAALFGGFVNLLMLTGPLFMLQVYDRVLSARSQETLVALMLIVVFLYAVMGLLDHARGRVMARVAARLRGALDGRVFEAALRRAARHPGPVRDAGPGALRELDAVERLVAAPVALALFDLPWAPLFLAGLFLFHPWLGWFALAGGAALVCLTALTQALTRSPAHEAQAASAAAERLAAELREGVETVCGLGMQGAAFARWRALRARALAAGLAAADRAGGFSAATRALRLLLQSAMLALGAWLVLEGALSGGAMVAASILLGRALAPVEQAIGQWEVVQQGVTGWRRLAELLAQEPPEPARIALPRPAARLEVEGLTLVPAGAAQPVLRAVSFGLEPGQALGVIGPSGAGKSALARALAGLWPPAAGEIRLDAAPLERYAPEALGRLVGYLPQQVRLFEGTVAENIARLDPAARDAGIVEAARLADAHRMIMALPQGYDTPLGAGARRLSGGQVQRLGLARALYGGPVLLVLDEPNAHLDNDGAEALGAAIRAVKAAGGAVVVTAHRPSALRECDLLLVLEGGVRRAFGPRDAVLRESVANHAALRRFAAPGGVA
jgi:ATP-binding cassette subfamily C protein